MYDYDYIDAFNVWIDFDVGQLVHLQSFTLFDAMSAIEIMDPRMDTGMLIEETTTNKFDIHKRLSADQTLGIMDRLVTREMAWISGHSLSQTVYTCIYFHHVKELNDMPMPTLTSNMSDILYGVLKSYVLATVKCCHYIWTEMTQGNVFEVNNRRYCIHRGILLPLPYCSKLIFMLLSLHL